ncbi:MAG: hypothetical protein RLZZ399_98 [Verrucomicrobiota bacterium]
MATQTAHARAGFAPGRSSKITTACIRRAPDPKTKTGVLCLRKALRSKNYFLQGNRLGLRHGLSQTDDPVALFELAALFEELDALEALENITFGRNSTGPFEAAMLGHKRCGGIQTVSGLPLTLPRLNPRDATHTLKCTRTALSLPTFTRAHPSSTDSLSFTDPLRGRPCANVSNSKRISNKTRNEEANCRASKQYFSGRTDKPVDSK